MNRWLLAAGLLAATTSLIHLLLGGAQIATPLLASALNDVLKLTLYACWHLVSVALLLSALVLLHACRATSRYRENGLLNFVALLWLGFGAVFLAIVLLRPEPDLLTQLPQWTLLLPVGLLTWQGNRAALRAQTTEYVK